MSKIGKMPISVPDAVKVNIADRHVTVEGPKGKLEMDLPPLTTAVQDEKQITVTRDGDDKRAKSMHGLCRSLLNNMVIGVDKGYEKRLIINGVGFRAAVQGDKVNMHLGYSHEINHVIPPQITVTVEQNTRISVTGPCKEAVGKMASELRSYYPVEPYKGKGVQYSDEQVQRKKGKREQ